MARRAVSSDYRAMKHVIAIILLCLPAQLSAAQRCAISRHDRGDIAHVVSAKPPVHRVDIARSNKVRPPAAWRRVLLFEVQIL